MLWLIKQGDILDEPADVLICSANPQLNLSGGVGGELRHRYGEEMQQQLHAWLAANGLRHVERGAVVDVGPGLTPYRTVLHAVGIDAFYDTSPAVIKQVVGEALLRAAELSAGSVALTAIGTGYGRLSLADFAAGLVPLTSESFPPLAQVTLCLRNQHDVAELAAHLPCAVVA